MSQLFRSKSCGLRGISALDSTSTSPSLYLTDDESEDDQVEDYDDDDDDGDEYFANPISTPLIVPPEGREGVPRDERPHFPILEVLLAALRRSLVTCSVEREDICSMDISWPTDVRHISHVTFDRYNGFLGLPVELQPDVPARVPSASASVFGVSAESMQCSHDQRGNSVPTVLLMMQRQLYSGNGLQAEGIFRINAENSQEVFVRNQLNKGIVPHGIDVHCLAGLIKAWFRELPRGVLDSLTPEQVMHCNTEEECVQLARLLPPTEAALLDWAINLMSDVVQHEHHNKMNARNIAMVFAPNMTQMADPLTALVHAVQVMNFLKTLIIKTLREREESVAEAMLLSSGSESPGNKNGPPSPKLNREIGAGPCEQTTNVYVADGHVILGNYIRSPAEYRFENDSGESFWSFHRKPEVDEQRNSTSRNGTHAICDTGSEENECLGGDTERFLDRLSLRKGVKKLCRHPVFQFSKPVKKSGGLGGVDTRGGEAWE
ncbi:PREDICTED: rho GTPase-activating protein 3-like [Nelumbo nucifera]|uniref:Rho GTPase-activating protein 3-like n=1 Tax=Nelumbo nucifera TaxID=4432 RepID=A0A1U7ZDR8_NELNU|nr:PREDICTED: rho GTPase-activating protein 3-like [Nelumbo nucifera]